MTALAASMALALGNATAQTPGATQLPTGGTVTAGQASISQSGAVMTIDQGSQRAAIDWNTFNVGAAATVNFNQPSASSVTLNRVLDSNPSQIFGRINATGQVFFTNPNGVYFAPGASVEVGGLLVTTHNISTTDFMAGNDRFTRDGASGSIVNEGTLKSGMGGYIALLAPEVRNNGLIVAQLGTVALAAGDAFDVQFNGNGLSNVRVEPGTLRALVENGNAVEAPGGLIILSANAANQLQGSVVRNSGTLSATSLVSKGGRVVLEGDDIRLDAGSRIEARGATGGGTVLVGGDWQGGGTLRQAVTVTQSQGASIDASAITQGDGGKVVLWSDIHNDRSQTRAHGSIAVHGGAHGGNGGVIETSGHWLDVAGITIDTHATAGQYGNWLLDPYNITIAAAGASGTAFSSNYTANSTSVILASDIATALASGNVTIQTGGTEGDGQGGGDITIASNITKTSGGASTLTLKAHRDIVQNAGVSVSSTSGALNVVYHSDSDATQGGNISLNTGASILSNGGHITLSGGLDVNTGYATGSANTGNRDRGVFLDNVNLDAAGGNILVRGQGWSGSGAATPIGVDFSFNSIMQTTGSGTITVVGVGGSPTSGTAPGINMYIASGTAATVITQNGAITLTGTGGGTASQSRNAGINYETSTSYIYSTGGGPITLNGTGDNNGNAARGIAQANGGRLYVGTDGTTTYGSDIVLNANSMNLENAFINTTGNVSLISTGAATQTSSGSIIANALSLTGTGGDFSLTRSLNDVTTLAASTGAVNFVDANGLSIGTAGSTSGITATGNVTVTASAGSVGVDQNIIKSAGNDATLTLKATDNVTLASGKSITSSSNRLNVVLNADSDSNGGAINLDTGSSITTNGGHVTMGGGSTPGSGNATGNATYAAGIRILDAQVNAGTGTISLRGTGASSGGIGVLITGSSALVQSTSGDISIHGTGAGSAGGRVGILVDASAIVRTTGGGNISMTGQGSTSGTNDNQEGVKLDNNALVEILSGSNRTMTINGTGGSGNSYNIGVNARGGGVFRMGSGVTGTLNVTGTGGTCTSTGCWGILIEGGRYESLGAASIVFTGTGGTGADNIDIRYTGGTGSRIGSSSMTGNITLSGNTFNFGGDNVMRVVSSGALAIKPRTAGTTIGISGGAGTLALSSNDFANTFANGFSSITIGDATSGTITVGGATTLNDTTAFISNGAIALDGNLDASGQTLTLTAGSGQNVSGNGTITASYLLLNGSGANYQLDGATAHAVGTLAADIGSGSLAFNNGGALTIGSVGGVDGITTSSTVDVATLSGNLTLARNVSTTDSTASAVRLIAGKDSAAGTASGGDIVVSDGAGVSVGNGGFATLYSGRIGGSSGLTAMVGSGSGRFRYNSDEAATNYATALTAGINAIYREQPTVTVRATDVSKTYDAKTYEGSFPFTYNDLANGDSSSVFSGTVMVAGPARTATTIGEHAITTTGNLSNGLGYAVAYAGGVLSITAPLEPPAPPAPPPVAPSPKPETSPPPLTLSASEPAKRSGESSAPDTPSTAPPTSFKVPVPGTSQSIEVSVVQSPSAKVSGVIAVAVPRETATSGTGFSFPLPDQVFEGVPSGKDAEVKVSLAGGGALPGWLRYVPATRSFSAAAVPDGAFPVQVVVTIGTQTTTIVISERAD
ncbi:two-partner secretion domain-containing protein [Methyloversatilis thermotolerans]|uniref:two-partner secretion domain-containing protein n=1 Tax=Methyloversatilis thermotolerans TaxID=1346290 RepID=UPI0018DEE959|nr:filamentous hemagglutinin N-terminal domain-containing protein [Methyloversatilis thermotolerans]